MSEKRLSEIDQRSAAVVLRKERSIIRKARRVVERGAIDATAIDDDGPAPADWDARRVRVARDMRASKRNAPVYIDVLSGILDRHAKVEAAKAAAPVPLNIAVINVVQAPPSYEVLDVEVKDE